MAPTTRGYRLAIVSTALPRRCGLATYTADVRRALGTAAPDIDVVVAAIDRDGLDYDSEVVAVIDTDNESSYRAAARRLAYGGADAVLIQHEYGIFGGPDGAHVLALADELTACGVPYLVTPHTVLSQPSPGQQATLAALCAGAAHITVFTPTAARILVATGRAPAHRLTVVPHGAPVELLAAATVDPQHLPAPVAALGADRPVLTTFGLISEGKGLDHAIEALATVADRHPGVRYVIAGQTHPEVARHHGETYRAALADQAVRLGLGEHVAFVDRFLSIAELAALLHRTTIFVTPYRSPEQICSGALTFALAAGRPVVSTAYRYAQDMLAGGAGLLTPCGEPAALANALDTLLANPDALARARAAARAASARLGWPTVAAQLSTVVGAVVEAAAAPQRRPALAAA